MIVDSTLSLSLRGELVRVLNDLVELVVLRCFLRRRVVCDDNYECDVLKVVFGFMGGMVGDDND